MKRQLKEMLDQLGWQGIAGIVMLLMAALFSQVALDPLEHETAMARARLESFHSNSRDTAAAFASGDRQQLAKFFGALPHEEDVTDTLAIIYDVAQRAGVQMQQAQYHVDNTNPSEIGYEISFPMRGEYPRIRIFLSRVLKDNPALALDHISFQRDHIDDATYTANVKFTLFLNPSR